jgi:hypothetical protein
MASPPHPPPPCRPRPVPASDGRVEHVVSGQALRFCALAEWLAFMTRVLTEVEAQADAP